MISHKLCVKALYFSHRKNKETRYFPTSGNF
nr:MAG TPA: hypothetical protein [Caudoviricetes sp.]